MSSPEEGPTQQVFYLLEREDSPIVEETPRFGARFLRGHHADFWADVAPYLTVLVVEEFLTRCTEVEAELSTLNERAELDRLRNWVRAGGLPVVGFQLETRS